MFVYLYLIRTEPAQSNNTIRPSHAQSFLSIWQICFCPGTIFYRFRTTTPHQNTVGYYEKLSQPLKSFGSGLLAISKLHMWKQSLVIMLHKYPHRIRLAPTLTTFKEEIDTFFSIELSKGPYYCPLIQLLICICYHVFMPYLK